MSTTKSDGSARDRLLAAANELFYAEGVHTVGIDRVIEHAGVAKASLYSAFGSKEQLIVAYLQLRAKNRQRRIEERLARVEDPSARVVALFEFVCELVAEPGFRGCAFANASAEGPQEASIVNQTCIDSRAWTKRLMAKLAREAGAKNPESLGRQFALLYDGAIVAAGVDRDPSAAKEALAAAKLLLELHAPNAEKPAPAAAPRSKSRRRKS